MEYPVTFLYIGQQSASVALTETRIPAGCEQTVGTSELYSRTIALYNGLVKTGEYSLQQSTVILSIACVGKAHQEGTVHSAGPHIPKCCYSNHQDLLPG